MDRCDIKKESAQYHRRPHQPLFTFALICNTTNSFPIAESFDVLDYARQRGGALNKGGDGSKMLRSKFVGSEPQRLKHDFESAVAN